MVRSGIAANRRREVAIALAGQRVVAFLFGAVDGPLQAAEHGVVDGVLLRLAGHFGQQSLQLEAAFQAFDLDAQSGDEFGQAP